MLYCDTAYASVLFLYMLYCSLKLMIYSSKYCHFESRNHMCYFVLTTIGLLLALPLVINDLLYFVANTDEYSTWRWGYFQDWMAKTLPSVVYIIGKRNEDCFNCFNRLAP